MALNLELGETTADTVDALAVRARRAAARAAKAADDYGDYIQALDRNALRAHARRMGVKRTRAMTKVDLAAACLAVAR